MNNAHDRAVRDSKMAAFRLYDLRHTWATTAAMSGIDLVTLAAMLGHSSIQMVLRYPRELEKLDGVSPSDWMVLDLIIARIARSRAARTRCRHRSALGLLKPQQTGHASARDNWLYYGHLMEIAEELLKRKEDLSKELDRAISQESHLAHLNHRFSVCFMVAALSCSVSAAILGFWTDVSSKVVGGLAILPALIAFVAVNLKLERKSSWHYRKRDGLQALRSRLLYQQPVSPSADNIAAIAEAWDKLNQQMQEEWDKDMALNWSGLQTQQR